MAKSINQIILVGNLGQDPEVRTMQSGIKLATFTLCTEFGWKDKKKVTWHKIICWRKLADIAETYLEKGDQVYVQGRIESRKWKDRKGNDQNTMEIIVETICMMGSASDRRYGSNGEEEAEGTDNGGSDGAPTEDDIPF